MSFYDKLDFFNFQNTKLEIKTLPAHLEYAYMEEGNQKPVIIASDLTQSEKQELVQVLKKRKNAIAWKITDIKKN